MRKPKALLGWDWQYKTNPCTDGIFNLISRCLTVLIISLAAILSGCATLPGIDAPNVRVVGMEPLPSEGLEVRFTLKLRVQNPNDTALRYNGLAVNLNLDGRGLANGVSDAAGEIPPFSDDILTVPVSISAFSAFRQLMALAKGNQVADDALREPVDYKLTGKLGAPKGGFRATRFTDRGELDLFSTEGTK